MTLDYKNFNSLRRPWSRDKYSL